MTGVRARDGLRKELPPQSRNREHASRQPACQLHPRKNSQREFLPFFPLSLQPALDRSITAFPTSFDTTEPEGSCLFSDYSSSLSRCRLPLHRLVYTRHSSRCDDGAPPVVPIVPSGCQMQPLRSKVIVRQFRCQVYNNRTRHYRNFYNPILETPVNCQNTNHTLGYLVV